MRYGPWCFNKLQWISIDVHAWWWENTFIKWTVENETCSDCSMKTTRLGVHDYLELLIPWSFTGTTNLKNIQKIPVLLPGGLGLVGSQQHLVIMNAWLTEWGKLINRYLEQDNWRGLRYTSPTSLFSLSELFIASAGRMSLDMPPSYQTIWWWDEVRLQGDSPLRTPIEPSGYRGFG